MQEYAAEVGKSHLSFNQLCDDPDNIHHVHQSLRHRGKILNFAKIEIPTVITLVKEEWSQDNNLLTAAMKMKRKQVNDYYRDQIRAMFGQTSQATSGPTTAHNTNAANVV